MSIITGKERTKHYKLMPESKQEFIDVMRAKLNEQGIVPTCAMEIMLRNEYQTQLDWERK